MGKLLQTKIIQEEDNYIPISALEHFSYCPRQCALIHIERVFEENVYTLRGRAIHERVDEPGIECIAGVRIERSLPVWSHRIGLTGKADVVEFNLGVPFPIDYKHGRRRANKHADLQLCAQALCLEEMLDVSVPKGAIYHFGSRRRREVIFSDELKESVKMVTEEIRIMLQQPILPPPLNDQRCRNCSLKEVCVPKLAQIRRIEKLLNRLYEPI